MHCKIGGSRRPYLILTPRIKLSKANASFHKNGVTIFFCTLVWIFNFKLYVSRNRNKITIMNTGKIVGWYKFQSFVFLFRDNIVKLHEYNNTIWKVPEFKEAFSKWDDFKGILYQFLDLSQIINRYFWKKNVL